MGWQNVHHDERSKTLCGVQGEAQGSLAYQMSEKYAKEIASLVLKLLGTLM